MDTTPLSTIQAHIINSHAPVEVANAVREMAEIIQDLRKVAADHKEFINWIVQEIDDYDQLCRIVERAVDNPADMNKDCPRSVEIFLDYVSEDTSCDHEVGICNCRLRKLLSIDQGD